MRVRDDDVFLIGRGYSTPEACAVRFKEVHEIIAAGGATHVAAIICGSLHEFPEGVAFMQERMAEGELIPEVHGWDHINYGELSETHIVEHLNRSIDMIQDTFDYDPKIWYTPWGGNDPHMMLASELVGLKMVDCSEVVDPKRKAFGSNQWKAHAAQIRSEERELFIHWWQDRWTEVESHNLAKVLQTVKEDRLIFEPC